MATSAALLTAGLAACGTVKELTAAQKLSNAFGKLGDSKDLSVKFDLDATPDQLMAYGKATGEKMEQQDADAVAGLGISVALHADKPLKELESVKHPANPQDAKVKAEAEAINVDYQLTDRSGAALIEFRQVGGVVYLRGDISGLAKLSGEDGAAVRGEFDKVAADLGPLHDALTGSWVSLDAKTLEEFGADPTGEGAPVPSAAPSLDPKTTTDLLGSLKGILSNDLTFASKGTVDGADQVQVTAPFRKAAEDLLKAVKPVMAQLPTKEKLPDTVPADVPDKNVAADFSIKNGVLVGARFDLAQLDSKATADVHLPLKIAVDTNAPVIQAPDKAAKLTETDLQQALMAMVAGFGDAEGDATGTGGAADSSLLKGSTFPTVPAPPLTAAQVKELTAKTGQTPESITALNQLGLGYDEILGLGAGEN
ncbi:hypothetical protein OG455_36070 [Kitasatospora sp. NBC_01287]|uniref:hypothetical protein n=1 Tax=Kitasatospora sp. NBC_01287 TaxID=2903573 RepID=UPI002257A1FA|nr:hypothetical protein [Kitasatospora sp. NBC_01287]MCX4750861.1 hypothetical protein [Kitasatospora sp. NBC_01287]